MIEVILESKGLLIADHSVGFACSSGSVGKDSGVIPIEYSFDERMCGFEIDLYV